MKILKFGGKSLANDGIEKVIDIIITSHKEPLSVVVSARGNTTDELEALLEKASWSKQGMFGRWLSWVQGK